jgi:hypothetical protein
MTVSRCESVRDSGRKQSDRSEDNGSRRVNDGGLTLSYPVS